MRPFDHRQAEHLNRRLICDAIRAHTDLSSLAFFCHGTANSLPGTGFRGAEGVVVLADAIRQTTGSCTVTLYSCSTCKGFARHLAAELGGNYQVWSHMTPGHTTRNPMLCWSRGDESIEFWGILNRDQRAHLRQYLTTQERFGLARLRDGRELLALLDARDPASPVVS